MSSRQATPGARAIALRAGGFLALATFAAMHWVGLVEDPPVARMLAAVAIATAGGAAAMAVRASPTRRWPAVAARLAILLLATAGAMIAVGLAPRLLAPVNWGELSDGLHRATGAVRTREWPYKGPDEWVRLGTLLVAPLTVCAAAALAFWPAAGRRAMALASAAIALLVTLYGVTLAENPPASPLVSGLALLAVLAVWLFLPRMRAARAVAIAMLVGAAAVALPLASWLPAKEPLLDYRTIGLADAARFEWNQTYGPLDWPRRGDVMFEAASDQPHYWKAISLDRFDGLAWVSGTTSLGRSGASLPDDPPTRWQTETTVVVGSLDSDLLLSPGPMLQTAGLEQVFRADDGTASTGDGLTAGASYSILAYAPNPSGHRMRIAPDRVSAPLRPYTMIGLPGNGEPNPQAPAAAGPDHLVRLPERGPRSGPPTVAERRVLASPYARVYQLARRLGARTRSNYDAVVRIQEFLRTNYAYSESPPRSDIPLDSFLFEDRVGYCQQFSGAMALMLRMNGIPARVAAGFAPGTKNGEGSFVVRDFDAHAWVEVWFPGIGWVPFDPTPAASPAGSRSTGQTASAALGAEGQAAQLARAARARLERLRSFTPRLTGGGVRHRGRIATPTTADETGLSSAGADRIGAPVGALMLILATMAAGTLVRWGLRQRTLWRTQGEVGELRAAVVRLGHRLPPGITLAQLERRLSDAGHAKAARYVGVLGARRYGPDPCPPLDPRARRALRRALTSGSGLRSRLRGYLALPPRRR